MPRLHRRRRQIEPYAPPPGAPPLREVVRAIGEKSAQIRALDEKIVVSIRKIERNLEAKNVKRLTRARIVPGVELAWSANKRGRWRFVIRDDDGAIDLLNADPEERLEAFTTGAMERLVKEMHGEYYPP